MVGVKKNNFDQWAPNYEMDVLLAEKGNKFPFIGYSAVIQAIVNQASDRKSAKVLDLGTGTGLLAQQFYKKKFQIFGLDFSDRMIALAREKMPLGHFETVDLENKHLGPFFEKSFEFIVSGYFFHHFTDSFKVNFLNQLYNENLSHSGKILIGDIGFDTPKEWKTAKKTYQSFWDKNEHYICGKLMQKKLEKISIHAEYMQISHCAGLLIITKI